MKCLAMDFGGSSVKVAVVDEYGNLTKKKRLPTPLESKAQFINMVTELYQNVKVEVDGIAISIPGYVDSEKGQLKESGVYQNLWGCNIPELLIDLDVPVAVENDGNCGALSEVWCGALRGCSDGVVVILGSGIGGGIVKNGKIHHGKYATSGEISYMILKPGQYGFANSPIFDIGMIGMTYKMCVAKNLDLSIQDAGETLIAIDKTNEGDTLRKEKKLLIKADGQQMFKWLDEGDEEIEGIYKEFIQNLAAMINNIQVIYAPEKIAIGGGLSLQTRIFDDVKKELDKFYFSMGIGEYVHAEVVPCQYLDETNLLGATYNFMLKNQSLSS